MSDAMEIMLLSILSPELQCTWQLTGAQEALLTTAVFAGMAVSSNVWGLLFDKYGRRFGLLFFAVISAYFGSLSALSPSYEWILVLRFIVGLGLGATPQSMTYYSEFLPTKSRGQCLLAIALLWALGSVLEAVLAIIIIPTLGWRWLVAISSPPLWGFA
ncbi:synaptic vesicle 2-related protein, partial [Aplysia californica]|uniref:Synaptic vesicle 2-related protein n=1 Tax=Aplysia californica TaxID=6500 RepID=A0ABM0ZUY1_APLCA